MRSEAASGAEVTPVVAPAAMLLTLAVADVGQGGTSVDVSNVWTVLLTWGPGGVVIVLILLGWLVPKKQLSQSDENSDNWRLAYEKERDSHNLTREALAKSEERGDLAQETARIANALLEAMQHNTPRRSHRDGEPT